MPSDLSVVICSLNGASGVDRCLRSLAHQTGDVRLEVIVVDDGSTDATSDVAHAHGVTVVRHDYNRGLAAARNSGIRAASAPIVAFLDDDCEPEPQWAWRLIEGYSHAVVGVGGAVEPQTPASFMAGYLERHNPLAPLEIDLARSNSLPYRFYLYLRQLWTKQQRHGKRDVYSLVGANMSFRRQALLDIGLFDERFRFGAEELDLCMRLNDATRGRLVLVPAARVAHHFAPSVRDTLRRSRAYGRGSARLYRKWPSVSPTIFPGPLVVLVVLLTSVLLPLLLVAGLTLPILMYPHGLRDAVIRRRPACILDAYLKFAQEACEDVGFFQGLWRFRHLAGNPVVSPSLVSETQLAVRLHSLSERSP
jgi:glycosyltransferase involved in cell wall biosynthesis